MIFSQAFDPDCFHGWVHGGYLDLLHLIFLHHVEHVVENNNCIFAVGIALQKLCNFEAQGHITWGQLFFGIFYHRILTSFTDDFETLQRKLKRWVKINILRVQIRSKSDNIWQLLIYFVSHIQMLKAFKCRTQESSL